MGKRKPLHSSCGGHRFNCYRTLNLLQSFLLLFTCLVHTCFAIEPHQQQQYLVEKINLNLINEQNLVYTLAESYVSNKVSSLITNINNMAYHKGYLYVAAQNWLVKLNAINLNIEQLIKYGPVFDSPLCRYHPDEECQPRAEKDYMNNHNKILIVYEKRNALLTCWTAHQGVCDLRDLNNLTIRLNNSSIPTVANDPFNSTVGLIATSPSSQDLFYVAATQNNYGPYRDEIPALSGRTLNSANTFMEILKSNSGLKSNQASIEFIARYAKSFIVNYINAFNLGVFNYFLSVQHMDTDSAQRGDLLITKLARICLNDLSFTKSYVEMPLKCLSGSSSSISSLRSIDYNELISAKLVYLNTPSESGFDFPSGHYIFGIFQQTNRNTFNSTLNENKFSKQAVCVFSMNQIRAKIKENLNRCYSSTQQNSIMRGLNFIKPDQRCARNRYRQSESNMEQQIGDDFCSSADNGLYPIGGQIPAVSNAILELDNTYDSIQVFSDTVATSLILLSSQRDEVKMFNVKSLQTTPFNYRSFKLSKSASRTSELVNTNSNAIKTNLQFELVDGSAPNLFIANTDSVYKVKMSACESFKTCQECLSINTDPHCGWCPESNQCTTNAQCTSSKWLNGVKLSNESSIIDSMCVDIDRIEPEFTYLDDAEWLQVNFHKDLSNRTDYQCVYLHDQNLLKTDAIQIASNQLKCPIPHSSKLKFQAYTNQNLALSEDGIFKSTNEYYYETRVNKLQLPVYIQSANVRYGAINDQSTMFNLTLMDCSAHTSCVSCLSSSSSKCNWCNNKCTSPLAKSESKCTNQVGSCASFDVGTNKLLIPYTAHRPQAPFTFNLINQENVDSQFECLFTLFDGKFLNKNISLPFNYLNKTHGQCILLNVFDKLPIDTSGQVQTNLRLYDQKNNVFVDSVSNGRLSLLFYKCEIKASDCSQCLALNKQFSCMWCNLAGASTCRFMNAQSKLMSQCISPLNNQCDKPEINSIQPIKLPVGGGTVITLNGVNLGSSFEDITSVYLTCPDAATNIRCDLIKSKYIPSKQLACRTRQSTAYSKCKLSVKLRKAESNVIITSSQYLEYVDPIISEIQPAKVIQSANFVWLTIKGFDLDAGQVRKALILDHEERALNCEIKNVTRNELKCRLNDKFRSLGKKTIKLIFDESMSIMHYLSLSVTSDPLVKSINKQLSPLAGGTRFLLNGYNFDAVQSAYTYVNFRDLWYSEPLPARSRISNELILFEFPPLTDSFFQLVAYSLPNYELEIGFLMDGFNVTLKEWPIEYVPNLSTLSVTNVDIMMQEKSFNLVASFGIDDMDKFNRLRDDLQVFVSCSMCSNIEWINDTALSCNLPSTNSSVSMQCEQKVLNSIQSELSTHKKFNMINFFIGNYEIKQNTHFDQTNENLKIYLQSYMDNNIDNFSSILALNPSLIGAFLTSNQSTSSSSTRNIFLLVSIIISLLIILITLSILLVILKLKPRNALKQNQFDRLIEQMGLIEFNVRAQSNVLLEQLENDYLTELNQETITNIPIWNYKTYLFNFLFSSNLRNNNTLIIDIPTGSPSSSCNSSSSARNNSSSTSTTLLTLTPVYATIKSTDMLMDASNKPTTATEAMHLFDQLIHNKSFLLTFIQVCEQNFTQKDRIHFASFLTLALRDNLPYLYSIIKCLISDYLAQCLKNRTNSNLFRSNDTLVEYMINNWLSMFMYDYQLNSAQYLYRLTKIIKFYTTMGPCDQVNQLAYNTLSEEYLLKENVTYQTLYVNIIFNNNAIKLCPLLDCDTIQQAKEKVIDSLFKCNQNKPSHKDIELELCLILVQNDVTQQQLIELKETEDELIGTLSNSSPHDEQSVKRLLTLKDYNVQNGSFLNLSFKQTKCMNEYATTEQYYNTRTKPVPLPVVPPPILPINKNNRYHFVKPSMLPFASTTSSSSTSSSSSLTSKKRKSKNKKKKYEKLLTVKSQDSAIASLINDQNANNLHQTLTRLLLNKCTLQPFIDQVIESIFMNTSNLPPVVQHLFEFIDQEIKKHQYQLVNSKNVAIINEETSRVAKQCKTNIYFTRYWSNFLRTPEYLLDIGAKNNLYYSSLNSVAQAFSESCSSTSDSSNGSYESSSTSPINRLLFVKETSKYKDMIDKFFVDMQSYQSISDHELHFYLNEFSKCKQQQLMQQQLGATLNQLNQTCSEINSIQILLQLYEFYEKYEQQVNTALGQQQCSILLPVHHRLVQIKDLMISQPNQHLINNTATLNRIYNHYNNPYQQVQYQQPIISETASIQFQSSQQTMHSPQVTQQHQQQQQFF